MTDQVRILFICLGNICRSPAAEGVMRRLVAEADLSDRIFCDSAGTTGHHTGEQADARMRTAATRRGLELTSRARRLYPLQDFERYHYFVTMDESNYRDVKSLEQDGELAGRLYRMCQFCSLRLDKQVPDPYYGGEDGFDNVLDLLEDACQGLLAHIRSEFNM